MLDGDINGEDSIIGETIFSCYPENLECDQDLIEAYENKYGLFPLEPEEYQYRINLDNPTTVNRKIKLNLI